MENEKFKEQIEWLERLGFRADVYLIPEWELYKVDIYKNGVNITTSTLATEGEVVGFLRGYIYATIDYQHAQAFM